jgi:phage shock protein A
MDDKNLERRFAELAERQAKLEKRLAKLERWHATLEAGVKQMIAEDDREKAAASLRNQIEGRAQGG